MTRAANVKALERDVQKQVVDYLRLVLPSDAILFAVPNGGYRRRIEAAILKGMGVVPGVADLILLYQGKGFAIEMKTDKGRQSSAQNAWQDAWEAAGGQYALCRGIEDIDAILARWGVAVKRRRAA